MIVGDIFEQLCKLLLQRRDSRVIARPISEETILCWNRDHGGLTSAATARHVVHSDSTGRNLAPHTFNGTGEK